MNSLLSVGDGNDVLNFSANSYVDGPVQKSGDDAWEFPTGDGDVFAPISISTPNAVNNNFRAEYLRDDPDNAGYNTTAIDTSLDHVSQVEYWTLDQVGGTADVEVTLSFENVRSGGVNSPGDLRICRWNNSYWEDQGNGATSVSTIVSNGPITQFSPFTLGSVNSNNPLDGSLVSGCETPDSLHTTKLTPTSARLHWSAVAAIDAYQIRGRNVNGFTWVYLLHPAATNARDVFGLTNNQTYVWQIRTFCNGGADTSLWSMIDTFSTNCYAPDSNWTDPVSSLGSRLNWSKVTGAIGYRIIGQRIGSGGWKTLQVGGGNTLHKDVFGLLPGTAYHWAVRAVCDTLNAVSDPTELDTFVTSSSSRLADNWNEWKVWPNPAREKINLAFSQPSEHEIVISSQGGQEIARLLPGETQYIVRTGNWPAGVYFIKVGEVVERLVIW